ncbi:hypothetical protein ABW19_dt0209796 [Dactylella cylindrospora]|nr:hypothetical protein ABW19_dt0209796 [Dactylella cylindrospora]
MEPSTTYGVAQKATEENPILQAPPDTGDESDTQTRPDIATLPDASQPWTASQQCAYQPK